jgi:Protein of unknown function (DUF3618)
MAPPQDRSAEDVRVDEIRRDIEAIRLRIALGIDALAYKADIPSRLGDALTSATATFTARFLRRLPGGAKDAEAEERTERAAPDAEGGSSGTSVAGGRP